LDEAPSQRVGVAAIWRFLPYAELTVEYLRGRYARGFAGTGDERPVDHVDQFGARVSIAF